MSEDYDAKKKEYLENVAWLKTVVAPEDIYDFAEQTIHAALFFMIRWQEWVDIMEEAEKCEATNTWVSNVLGLRAKKCAG